MAYYITDDCINCGACELRPRNNYWQSGVAFTPEKNLPRQLLAKRMIRR